MRHHLIVLVGFFLMSGCDQQQHASEPKVEDLETRLSKIESDNIAAFIDRKNVAYLKTSDTTFELISTDIGRLALVIDNVRPYATGAQVSVRIGNPTLARLSDIKAKIEWGSTDANGVPIDNGKRSMDWAPPESLPAGSWHNYAINLGDIPVDKLGWVRFSQFSVGSIALWRNADSN